MVGPLNETTQRSQNDQALLANARICEEISSMLASTLGAYGLDKMLVDSMGNNVITNDGATIMKMLDTQQPASKLLTAIAKTQDEQCGDGTTTTVLLAGAFLRGCRELRIRWGIHPTQIAKGYSLAREKCMELLQTLKIPCAKRDEVIAIAKTSLNSKSAKNYESSLVDIAVDAVKQIHTNGTANVKNIKIIKKSGKGVSDSELFLGMILPNNLQPGSVKSLKMPAIIILSGSLEFSGEKIAVGKWKDQLESVKGKKDSAEKTVSDLLMTATTAGGCKELVLLTRGAIDPTIMGELLKKNIMVVKNITEDDMKLVEVATGAIACEMSVLNENHVGHCDKAEEIIIGDEPYLAIERKASPAVTVIMRGGAYQSMDEIERGFHDCLMVVSDVMEDKSMLPGGGATMVELAMKLREWGNSIGGKEQFAVSAYADALETIPLTLARNGGMDELDILLRLRMDHMNGKKTHGVDYVSRGTGNMLTGNVVEPLRVVEQAIQSATEVSIQIIRVDDMLIAKQLSDTHQELNSHGIGK